MARFLFIVPPFMGHINPTLSIGAGLIERGHHVSWVGIKKLDEKYIPKGGKFIVPEEQLKPFTAEIDNMLDRHNTFKLSSPETLAFMFKDVFIALGDMMMEGVLHTIDCVQPDVVIHDEMMFAGAMAAYIREIPYVTSIAVPPQLFTLSGGSLPKIEQWQQNLLMELQRRNEINTNQHITASGKLTLVYTVKELCAEEEYPLHYHFVGPLFAEHPHETSFDWEKFNRYDRPKIYVSTGTLLDKFGETKKNFFFKIVEALQDQSITVVAAANKDLLNHWPDNFIVQPYVPQSNLMDKFDAVIYHGGFNTVNEAIWHGVPLIIIPVAYDNFHIASCVVKAGCGIRLNYKRLSTQHIKNALHEILNEKHYRVSANTIGNVMRLAGGTHKVVTLLENLIEEEKLKNNKLEAL